MKLEEEQISIPMPSSFICPISLEIMRDPVTLCTGITYDRAFIQKWLRQGKNVCPVTDQILHTQDLIPNHVLASVIHNWFLNVNTVAEPSKVSQLIRQIDEGSACGPKALRKLNNLAKTESNRACLESKGVLPALIRVLEKFQPAEDEGEAVQQAVGAIVAFSVEDVITRTDLTSPLMIRTLEWVLTKGNLESRMNAAGLVEKVVKMDKMVAKEIGLIDGITDGLLALFQQNATYVDAVSVSLKALLPLCREVTNRAKIAKAEGAVSALIELLPGADRTVIEPSLAILEAVSTTWEGRCAIIAHAVAVPRIVRSLLLVSHVATAHGVGILLNICNKEKMVIREVVMMGVLEKLLVLLHMDYMQKAKHRANQLLKILSPHLNHDFCNDFLNHL